MKVLISSTRLLTPPVVNLSPTRASPATSFDMSANPLSPSMANPSLADPNIWASPAVESSFIHAAIVVSSTSLRCSGVVESKENISFVPSNRIAGP